MHQFFSFLIIPLLLLPTTSLATDSAASRGPEQPETFEIDGTTYPIPEPWAGNRIAAPSPAAIEFRMIPKAHTYNGTKIYIEKNARDALQILMDAAKQEGVYLVVNSGFRSYNYQMRIFTRMMREGRSYEDVIRYVAPPGYSQHALGTAVDFYPSNWEFAKLPAYAWLQENALEYGFRETYPRINESGYPWEAWHWSYTGNEYITENGESGAAVKQLPQIKAIN